ncbi:MAG: Sec-independent protein translocase protein TatB [Lautropia sp.]
MFDFSLTEMMIVGVVALVVIGPERLPKVARQAGQWVTKLRRYVDDVKSDFNRQIELSELKDIKNQVQEAARNFEGSVKSAVADTQATLDSVKDEFESLGSIGGDAGGETRDAPTDWDSIYAVRRTRERIKDRRIEREKSLGIKRPRRPLHR